MLGHIFPVDFIHCIYIIKKLHAHVTGIYFGPDTSRGYCQGNHDQRNETYSVKAETFANVTVRLHV